MRIKFENVSFIYDRNLHRSRYVLKNINLEINSGEFIGLVGPSGAGKTTLLQHITGLLKPTTGKIFIDGRDIWGKKYSLNELRKKIGLVFQFPENQLFEETIFSDIAFGPKALNLSPGEIEGRIKQSLGLVGMNFEQMRDRSPRHLSEGEKRRVALAGILAMAPEMLILDEPTAGLDPKGAKLIVQILEQLNKEGITILLTTHNMEMILRLANRIIVLVDGSILFDGKKEGVILDKELLNKANLTIPKAVQISRLLFEKRILPNWKIFSVEELKRSLINLTTW